MRYYRKRSRGRFSRRRPMRRHSRRRGRTGRRLRIGYRF